MRNALDASKLELTETIVNIRRVAKTVKGGRNMRFSVTVVVGDGEGHVGVGLGKALEIPEAVRKATEDAKKNIITVPTVGTTIPHRQLGVFGAGFYPEALLELAHGNHGNLQSHGYFSPSRIAMSLARTSSLRRSPRVFFMATLGERSNWYSWSFTSTAWLNPLALIRSTPSPNTVF